MKNPKEVVYHHPQFQELSKKELDLCLDFLAKVLFNLNGFEVWEAENVFSEEDGGKWDEEVVERFKLLMEDKYKLEDQIYAP